MKVWINFDVMVNFQCQLVGCVWITLNLNLAYDRLPSTMWQP